MNAIAIFRAALIALALPFAANAQMVPANDRVRVEVQIVSDNDHKDIAKTSVDQITQNKTLTIKLSGKPKSPDTRVIKWTAYGRNVKSNSIQMLESGEFKLELATNGGQTVDTKRFASTYTPEHSVVSTSRSRSSGRSTPRAKRVEATGTKFAGYSVQVLDGGKVVGEKAEPENIGKPKQP
jgi:hypothetical protein